MRDYVSRLHLVGITTLVLLTVALALFGWSLRPASGGFPGLPPAMIVSNISVPGGLQQDVTESLTRTGDSGATLTLSNQTAAYSYVGLEIHDHWDPRWSIWLYRVSGEWRLCTPRVLTFNSYGELVDRTSGAVPLYRYPIAAQRVRHLHASSGTTYISNPTEIDGTGPFLVRLCWSSGGPVQVNGAYLSASFVTLYSWPTATTPVTRQLNLGSGVTTDYSVQSISEYTSITSGGWQWSTRSLPPKIALTVTAVNTTETQHDSYQAFLSGIVFGVAGGALVALIQELVAPFRSRKELRPPEPGG